jgi:hypothetical protein
VSGPPAIRNFAISGIRAKIALAPMPKTTLRIRTVRIAGDIDAYRIPAATAIPSVSRGSNCGFGGGRQRARTAIKAM